MTPDVAIFMDGLTAAERDALARILEVADQERIDPVETLLLAAVGAEGDLRAGLVGALRKMEVALGGPSVH